MILNRIKETLKRLTFPVTPLVILTALGILIPIITLFIVMRSENPSEGFLFGVAFGITQFLIVFYIIDRILVRKLTYRQIFSGELGLALIIIIFYSIPEKTIDINIDTSEDYILVVFDSKENLLGDFEWKDIIEKN